MIYLTFVIQMDRKNQSHLNILALYFKAKTKQSKIKNNNAHHSFNSRSHNVLLHWTETMGMGPNTGLQ